MTKTRPPQYGDKYRMADGTIRELTSGKLRPTRIVPAYYTYRRYADPDSGTSFEMSALEVHQAVWIGNDHKI